MGEGPSRRNLLRGPGGVARLMPNDLRVELRCQLRFTDDADGKRALLEARDARGCVRVTIEATGSDEGEALSALAERTRELYGAVCGIVDTVEDVARRYYDSERAEATPTDG
jgi:hypothetical protein